MSVKYNACRLFSAIFGVLLLTSTFAIGEAGAQGQVVYEMDTGAYGGEFTVPLNKSRVLRVTRPFADLRVGNPNIADVLPLTTQNVYILGKKPGSTSLSILGPDRNPIAVVDLMVSFDTEGIKRRLYELMPSEKIEVRGSASTVVLSGTVSSAKAASSAQTVANSFAPGKVTNLLQVKGSQQVMLSVRFAEMKRSLVKQLGVETNLLNAGSDATLGVQSGGVLVSKFGTIALTGLTFGQTSLDVYLDALEQKGVVKTLAEPNLIALSGETASFLAGGEFPIPVAQNATNVSSNGTVTGAITVAYKKFGVGLSFTPTVRDDDIINLVVAPEVSAIDKATETGIGGFSVPGLTTRRAQTTVELRDGQSFAIAGLLQSDFSDTIRQFPFLGDLPVIGALFRSTGYQKGETELVIVITPHLVQPASGPDKLALPTDNFVPPDELSLFSMGRTEGWTSGATKAKPEAKGGAAVNSKPQASVGGLDGSYGHIIE